jgi:hypothetical protein
MDALGRIGFIAAPSETASVALAPAEAKATPPPQHA